ncbi:unnamed protein product [Linum tenue]|uniref:Uncharacterized protein n=1 Tax=Linum tenue TaxID=586396 RepID=A0AAV0I4V4_9ROSI|nr:unnamed protein product [Linum tenue]
MQVVFWVVLASNGDPKKIKSVKSRTIDHDLTNCFRSRLCSFWKKFDDSKRSQRYQITRNL